MDVALEHFIQLEDAQFSHVLTVASSQLHGLTVLGLPNVMTMEGKIQVLAHPKQHRNSWMEILLKQYTTH